MLSVLQFIPFFNGKALVKGGRAVLLHRSDLRFIPGGGTEPTPFPTPIPSNTESGSDAETSSSGGAGVGASLGDAGDAASALLADEGDGALRLIEAVSGFLGVLGHTGQAVFAVQVT